MIAPLSYVRGYIFYQQAGGITAMRASLELDTGNVPILLPSLLAISSAKAGGKGGRMDNTDT